MGFNSGFKGLIRFSDCIIKPVGASRNQQALKG